MEKAVPKDQEMPVLPDHYATPKYPKVLEWIERPQRLYRHGTPTSASWLNRVERFFGTLTEPPLRRGVVRSVQDLERSLEDSLPTCPEHPRPLIGTKTADEMLRKVGRARQALAAAAA